MKETYREAFYEVNEIFKLMPDSLLNKIPDKFKKVIETEKSSNYNSNINEPLEDCDLKEETVIIMALIYRDFLCGEEEKISLKLRDAEKIKEAEDEIREKYNPDNIFNNVKSYKNIDVEKNDDKVKETSLIAVEEKWYKKIFDIIKRIFKRK